MVDLFGAGEVVVKNGNTVKDIIGGTEYNDTLSLRVGGGEHAVCLDKKPDVLYCEKYNVESYQPETVDMKHYETYIMDGSAQLRAFLFPMDDTHIHTPTPPFEMGNVDYLH